MAAPLQPGGCPLCSWNCIGASSPAPGPEPPRSHRTHPSLTSTGTPGVVEGLAQLTPPPPRMIEAACLPEPLGLGALQQTLLTRAVHCSRSSGQIPPAAHLADSPPQPGRLQHTPAPGAWYSCPLHPAIYVAHSPSPASLGSHFTPPPTKYNPSPMPFLPSVL